MDVYFTSSESVCKQRRAIWGLEIRWVKCCCHAVKTVNAGGDRFRNLLVDSFVAVGMTGFIFKLVMIWNLVKLIGILQHLI